MKAISRGFTFSELIVVVSILGVLTGLSINSGMQEWRREQVNAIAIELAGWLEQVRRSALRGRGCVATINGTSSTLGADNQLATSSVITGQSSSITDPNACLANNPLRIPSNVQGVQFNVTSTSITFTPRGSAILSTDPTNIVISLNGAGVVRCVKVGGILGLIEISKSSSCVDQESF